MTGYFTGLHQPLSLMTVRSLEDLGYQVDLDASESYVIGVNDSDDNEDNEDNGDYDGDDDTYVK